MVSISLRIWCYSDDSLIFLKFNHMLLTLFLDPSRLHNRHTLPVVELHRAQKRSWLPPVERDSTNLIWIKFNVAHRNHRSVELCALSQSPKIKTGSAIMVPHLADRVHKVWSTGPNQVLRMPCWLQVQTAPSLDRFAIQNQLLCSLLKQCLNLAQDLPFCHVNLDKSRLTLVHQRIR